MSTTARKARKRLRHQLLSTAQDSADARNLVDTLAPRFQHPVKIGTPVTLRHENQPRQIFGKGTQNAPTRYGVTSKVLRRIAAYIAPDTKTHGNPAGADQAQSDQLPLDPKPYRLGRKRLTMDEAVRAITSHEDPIFAPRSKFAQAPAAYAA